MTGEDVRSEPGGPAVPPRPPAETTAEARQWAMLSHVLALPGYLIAFGQFIGPLVIYLTKRDTHPFVADQARESLNFQITWLLVAIAGAVVVTICLLTCVLAPLGWLIAIALPVAHVVFVLIASVKAGEGVRYRYPIALRLVS